MDIPRTNERKESKVKTIFLALLMIMLTESAFALQDGYSATAKGIIYIDGVPREHTYHSGGI